MKKILNIIIIIICTRFINVAANDNGPFYYMDIDSIPKFISNNTTAIDYIENRLILPDSLRLSGTAILSIVINNNGEIKNPVIRGNIPIIVREQLDSILKKMPRWKPGKHNNKEVDVRIYFKINY